MDSILYTNSAAIREVLNNVDLTGISVDGKLLLEKLSEMAGLDDSLADDYNRPVHLCDLTSYRSYMLWEGSDNVERSLRSGQYDDLLCNILSEDLPELIEEITDNIAWEDECFHDCSAGLDLIDESIRKILEEHIKDKPFSFKSTIYYDDDHYNQWYGELQASDLLMEKLQKKVLSKKISSSLCLDPAPEFYVTYDLIKGNVSVYTRFFYGETPKRYSDTATLHLTSEESDILICCLENACRQLHQGKDCLAVINEARNREGLASVKQSLTGRIRFYQNIDTVSDICNPYPQEHEL